MKLEFMGNRWKFCQVPIDIEKYCETPKCERDRRQQYPVKFIIQHGTGDANFLVPLMARA
jgi:hypothetical protein